MYPGQFPTVKRNLFNIVLILDFSKIPSLRVLGGTISNIIERGIPFRFGLVPSTTSEESRKMARAVYWLVKNAGKKRAMVWVKKVSGMDERGFMTMTTVDRGSQLDWKRVREEFDSIVEEVREEKEGDELEGVTYESVVESTEESVLPRGVDAYTERLGAELDTDLLGHAFFNGKHLEVGQGVGFKRYFFEMLVILTSWTGTRFLRRSAGGSGLPNAILPGTSMYGPLVHYLLTTKVCVYLGL